ncbi:MAG: hypothetical protein QM831_31940 [Kofleriaceae bacterium]
MKRLVLGVAVAACGSHGSKPVPLGDVSEVSVDIARACAITTDHAVWCWGGLADQTIETPYAIPIGVTDAQQLGQGSCARLSTGAVKCWHEARDAGSADVPLAIKDIRLKATSLTVRDSFACNNDGKRIECQAYENEVPAEVRHLSLDYPNVDELLEVDFDWFCGRVGQAVTCKFQHGDQPTLPNAQPLNKVITTPIVTAAVNGVTTCAVLPTGAVDCFNTASIGEPPQVFHIQGVTDAKRIAVGTMAACAVDSKGAVACWDFPPDTSSTALKSKVTPAQPVANLTGVTSIGLGDRFGCAVGGDHRVKCWGTYKGRLGIGRTSVDEREPFVAYEVQRAR